jgi:hypothetical protein
MDDDTRLEADLSRAAQIFDPVPDRVTRAAEAAFTIRDIDAELAELTFDSRAQVASLRSGQHSRLLVFTAPAVTIELEILDGEIIGSVLPARPLTVEVIGLTGGSTVTCDDLGRFTATLPGAGPFRLRCHAGPGVVTEWVSAR